jgi:hypothetical protein
MHGDDPRSGIPLSLCWGSYPLPSGHFDEAFATTGTARSPCAAVMDALAQQDLVALRERVQTCSAVRASLAALVARRQDKLRDDQVRRQARLGTRAQALDLDLDHDRALTGVKRRSDGDYLIAGQAGGEDVELELDRGEVVARRDVAEGRPGAVQTPPWT